jgi:uncharacterized membrane protein
VTKRYGAAIHPAALNAPAMLVGAAVLALVGVATGETLRLPGDRATWFAVMYLAIAGSAVTFLIYFWLLKTWSATTLSFIAVVTPLVAVVLGFLVRGERATAGMAVGGALIVGSVVLAMWTTMPLPARSPLQMSGKSIAWILGAVVAFVLAVSGVLFGVNLLPNGATAQEKGTFIPWLVTWAMIALTTVSGVVLAGFLVVTGLNEGRR